MHRWLQRVLNFLLPVRLESSLFSVLVAYLEFNGAVRVIQSRFRQVLIPTVIGERREKNSLRQARLLEDKFGGGRCVYPP